LKVAIFIQKQNVSGFWITKANKSGQIFIQNFKYLKDLGVLPRVAMVLICTEVF